MNKGYTQSSDDKKSVMARKMYTMNAVTPTSKSKGMKYKQSGPTKLNTTMNASVPAGRAGQKPEMAYTGKKQAGTMSGVQTGGMKPVQSNKGNFSASR